MIDEVAERHLQLHVNAMVPPEATGRRLKRQVLESTLGLSDARLIILHVLGPGSVAPPFPWRWDTGDAAVAVHAGNRPSIPVAEGFAAVSAEVPFVAPGDHGVADGCGPSSCHAGCVLAEVAQLAALLLRGEVERVDVLVRLGDQGNRHPRSV
jgi:hypothetical protein